MLREQPGGSEVDVSTHSGLGVCGTDARFVMQGIAPSPVDGRAAAPDIREGARGPLVVHVVSSLQVGGAERFVLDLAAVQIQGGVSVRVLSLGRSSDPLVGEAEALGPEVVSTKASH